MSAIYLGTAHICREIKENELLGLQLLMSAVGAWYSQ